MKILKVKGKDEKTILNQIKRRYGDNVTILSTTEEKGSGLLNIFKKSKVVITIATDADQDEPMEVTKIKEQEDETYKLLVNLTEQVNSMQQSIKNIGHYSDSVGSKTIMDEDENEESIESILTKNLLLQGVDKDTVSMILNEIDYTESIEEIVRKIYENIDKMVSVKSKGSKDSKDGDLPQLVVFVGATGVGKTTTIAKLTADYVLNRNKNVALFTSDTYRIAAIDQLKTYADILRVPIEIIYSDQELTNYLDKWHASDHIFIDTAGRSHKNDQQLEDLKSLLDNISNKKVFLVVNSNISTKDFKKIFDIYSKLYDKLDLIVTKIDETDDYGNILNIINYSNICPYYITNGQNVPHDIEKFNLYEYTSNLLGRIKNE